MGARSVKELKTVKKNVNSVADAALNAGNGVLRLTPNWVPRSFCYPGRRLKLHPDDLYAFGSTAAVSTSAGSARPPGGERGVFRMRA